MGQCSAAQPHHATTPTTHTRTLTTHACSVWCKRISCCLDEGSRLGQGFLGLRVLGLSMSNPFHFAYQHYYTYPANEHKVLALPNHP
jgi:hypothetical protein